MHQIVNMVREIVKVLVLLILLIQSQTGSYNFLHEIKDTSNKILLKEGKLIQDGLEYPVFLKGFRLSKQAINGTHHNIIMGDHHKDEMEDDDENFHNDEIIELSTKMDPKQLLVFEQKLLKLLGMKKRPTRDRDKIQKVPKLLRQLYENQLDKDIPTSNLNIPGKFLKSANTVRSFYNTGNEIDLDGLHAHLQFDISSIPSNEEIMGAEIIIPFIVIENSSTTNTRLQILVHDIVKLSKQSPSKPPISYPVDTTMVKLSKSNSTFWHTFDIFPAINRWIFQKSKKNLSLGVEFVLRRKPEEGVVDYKHRVRVRRSSTTKTPANVEEAVPILLTYSDDGHGQIKKARNAKTLSRQYRTSQNQRRRKNHRQKNKKRNLCSRKKMFVDFTDVGWNNWIVAPAGYQAFYCSGECPFPMAEHLNATNHAVIQALVHSQNPYLVPSPCCVPNKYSSLSLLYTDTNDRIILKNYNEMVVLGCGCS